MGFPEELLLPTFSARLVKQVVVFVCQPNLDIGEDDWQTYAHEVEKALAYLGEDDHDHARFRATIREFGGVVHKAAP